MRKKKPDSSNGQDEDSARKIPYNVRSIRTTGHLPKELREVQTDFTLTVRLSEIQHFAG
ncbi:MAG: hypothetical protein LBP50_02335 [Tannerella sp.]|nr:hypothetical protein [Tannerella sp.]